MPRHLVQLQTAALQSRQWTASILGPGLWMVCWALYGLRPTPSASQDVDVPGKPRTAPLVAPPLVAGLSKVVLRALPRRGRRQSIARTC